MAGNAAAFADKGADKAARLLSSAASDNATVAINGPCQLRGIIGSNARTTAVYLKLYALAATLVAPASTDTPVLTIHLPPSSDFAIDLPGGFNFNFGLGFRLTTGSADNDTGAVAAGDILGLNLLAA